MNEHVKTRRRAPLIAIQSALIRTIKSFLFLFLLSSHVFATAVAAQTVSVKISMHNATVGNVIEKLHQQTGYEFSYDAGILSEKLSDVSVEVRNERIETVLSHIFSNTNISFKVINNRVFLKDAESVGATKLSPADTKQQPVSKKVSGVIKDKTGETVIGATVVERGNPSNGTITDIDGNFVLNVSADAVLEVTYVGYQAQNVSTAGRNSLNIVLLEDTKTLDELVVVGYGTQRKENLTGAVSAIKMEDVLGDRPVSNAYAALQGSIPGLTITGGSSPGQAGKSINIRGILSINGGSPLVLIDNVPGDLNMVNPDDIESISVLKDAASSAIYGARAANGVVLVNTKRPKGNSKFQLSYNNNFGYSSSINRPEQAPMSSYFKAYQDAGFSNVFWANSQDVKKWAQYMEEYKSNPSKFNTIGDGIYVDESGIPYYLNEKDIFKNVLETGFYNSHNVSASGGTENVRYRMSGGLVSDDGPLITNKDTYKRMNIGTFVSADMTSWFTQEVDMKYSRSKQTSPQGRGNDIYTLRLGNYYPEGLMPGSLTMTGEEVPLFTPRNLILYSNTSNTTRHNQRIFSKSIFKPIKDLDVVLEYTFDRDDYNYSYYSDKWKHTTIQLAVSEAPSNDQYTRQRYYTDYNAINTYASYSKDFNNHNFKIMGGFSQETSFYELLHNQVKDQVSSVIPSIGNSTGEKVLSESYSEYAIRGGFFRLNYNYFNKYLFEVNGRYDGSSKFPKANRFGFFPSVSAGWQIGEENFMSFSRNWLDQLKVRASWGVIGNQSINPYQYSPSMGINNSNGVWLIDGSKVITIHSPGLVSSTFTWENVETIDVGLDFSLLNNRLTGTYDWYQRNTKGMITKAGALQLPGVVGTEAPAQNGADMRTRGWEFAINWRNNIGDFGYNIGFNIYDHNSTITKFANEAGLFYNRNDAQDDKRYREGMKLGEIWGYVSDGYYSINDFENTTTWKLKEGVTSIQSYNVRPGDMKFKNLIDSESSVNQINDGDNTLSNPGDRKIIGNSTARFQYGANLGVNYKSFDLSVMLQGVGKRDVWMGGASMFPFAGSGSADAVFQTIYSNQTDYWRPISEDPSNPNYMVPENPNAKYYRIYGQVQNVGSNTRISDKYLQSAAYLRIKNITFSYVFPKHLTQKIQISNLKLFVGVENLATFTSLPNGVDPERISWNYPFYRTMSFGTNITF